METKLQKVIAIFGLLAVFFAFPIFTTSTIGPKPVEENIFATEHTKIVVTEVVSNFVITSENTAEALPVSCFQSPVQTKTLVQDQAHINLNQPAGCFAFSKTTLRASSQIGLSVKPLVQFEQKVVVLPAAKISAIKLTAALPKSIEPVTIPAMTILEITLYVGFGLALRKIYKMLLSQFKSSINLHSLNVMRC
jgi:hypothetical protein